MLFNELLSLWNSIQWAAFSFIIITIAVYIQMINDLYFRNYTLLQKSWNTFSLNTDFKCLFTLHITNIKYKDFSIFIICMIIKHCTQPNVSNHLILIWISLLLIKWVKNLKTTFFWRFNQLSFTRSSLH